MQATIGPYQSSNRYCYVLSIASVDATTANDSMQSANKFLRLMLVMLTSQRNFVKGPLPFTWANRLVHGLGKW